jgi:PRTRC genetic system ThiF family protein
MQSLEISPPLPFLLPPDAPIQVVLVGAGGTGSHILQSLARIAAHLGPAAPQITVIDGDTVEPKNVGRQLFSAADVGLNKAQALAARFSAVFGLKIVAVPQMATTAQIYALRQASAATRILVGAVDTPAARKVLHTALGLGYARIWLDCGNEEHSGQVCVGTKTDAEQLKGALALGLCRDLPAPSLVYPNLIEEPKAKKRAGDCAAQMEQNLQGLMVNQAVAAVAAQYLHDLIILRRLTTFETTISLAPIAMRSRPITAAAIAEAAGIPIASLAPPPARVTPKKGRRAA